MPTNIPTVEGEASPKETSIREVLSPPLAISNDRYLGMENKRYANKGEYQSAGYSIPTPRAFRRVGQITTKRDTRNRPHMQNPILIHLQTCTT
jgi:hypothetical protein